MQIVAYWAVRTAVFLVVLGILYLVGWFDLIAVVAAMVIAWLVGYIALPGMRQRAAEQMAGVMSNAGSSRAELDAEEDAEVDAVSGEPDSKARPEDDDAA